MQSSGIWLLEGNEGMEQQAEHEIATEVFRHVPVALSLSCWLVASRDEGIRKGWGTLSPKPNKS